MLVQSCGPSIGIGQGIKVAFKKDSCWLKKKKKVTSCHFLSSDCSDSAETQRKKYFGFEFCKDGFLDCNYQIRLEKLFYLLYLLTYWYASATFPVHVFLFSNFFSLCDTAGSFAAVQISAARSVYFFVFLIFLAAVAQHAFKWSDGARQKRHCLLTAGSPLCRVQSQIDVANLNLLTPSDLMRTRRARNKGRSEEAVYWPPLLLGWTWKPFAVAARSCAKQKFLLLSPKTLIESRQTSGGFELYFWCSSWWFYRCNIAPISVYLRDVPLPTELLIQAFNRADWTPATPSAYLMWLDDKIVLSWFSVERVY